MNAPKSYSPLRPTRDVSPRRLVVWCTAAATNLRARSSHYQGLDRPLAFRTLTPACECRSAAKLRRSRGFQLIRLLPSLKGLLTVLRQARTATACYTFSSSTKAGASKGDKSFQICRAALGSSRGAPAFPGKRGRFRRPKSEGLGLLRRDGGLDLPSSVRLQPGTTDSAADIRPLIRTIPDRNHLLQLLEPGCRRC